MFITHVCCNIFLHTPMPVNEAFWIMDCTFKEKIRNNCKLCTSVEFLQKDKVLMTNRSISVLLFQRQSNSTIWNGNRGIFSCGGGANVARQTLEDIAKNIREQKYKRVVVMAGAGISTPSGIPDFRYKISSLVLVFIFYKYILHISDVSVD